MECMYRVGEFAALTGVSVRTLHHYHRVGVLGPSRRAESGYRLYSERDLLRMQQILTLRYLGFPLKDIGDLLSRPDFDLVASLRIQRMALRDRISELERIDSTLGELLDRRLETGQWVWDLVAKASAAVQKSLEQKGEKQMQEYYSPDEMRQRFDEIGERVSPEEIRDIEQRWTALLREVRSSLHLDPASPEARDLADRWNALQQDTFRHYPDDDKLMASIGDGYRQGRYTDIEGAPRPEDFAFIARVNEVRGGEPSGGAAGR